MPPLRPQTIFNSSCIRSLSTLFFYVEIAILKNYVIICIIVAK